MGYSRVYLSLIKSNRLELTYEEIHRMTRKDYQLIAEVFANLGQIIDIKETVAVDLARNLADALETDNPRFDRARFLVACGVN